MPVGAHGASVEALDLLGSQAFVRQRWLRVDTSCVQNHLHANTDGLIHLGRSVNATSLDGAQGNAHVTGHDASRRCALAQRRSDDQVDGCCRLCGAVRVRQKPARSGRLKILWLAGRDTTACCRAPRPLIPCPPLSESRRRRWWHHHPLLRARGCIPAHRRPLSWAQRHRSHRSRQRILAQKRGKRIVAQQYAPFTRSFASLVARFDERPAMAAHSHELFLRLTSARTLVRAASWLLQPYACCVSAPGSMSGPGGSTNRLFSQHFSASFAGSLQMAPRLCCLHNRPWVDSSPHWRPWRRCAQRHRCEITLGVSTPVPSRCCTLQCTA